MKLLHIDSSGRRNSASPQLTSEFVVRWKREYPDGEVTQRDLAAEAFSPAPMHNFTIAWLLKDWIDQIVRVGKTVAYGEKGPRGVLEGKQVVVISSRGGSRRTATHSFPRRFSGALSAGRSRLRRINGCHLYSRRKPISTRSGGRALLQIKQTIAELGVACPPNSASEYATDAR